MSYSPLQRQLLLRSYLLASSEVPSPIIYWGKTTWLSRAYLCHLCTGGKFYEAEDLVLVDILLKAWENDPKKAGRPS